MIGNERRLTWLPPWVRRVGAPVWITAPDRTLCYINERAETLLGLSSSRSIGSPCYRVIAGRDGGGLPYCQPRCPTFCQAQKGCELKPLTLRIHGAEPADHWLHVIVIPTKVPNRDGRGLVHCAIDAGHEHRMEEYLARVASRTRHQSAVDRSCSLSVLSAREREVFSLLCEDANLATIADRLHVIRVTVRNHVQHILAKLDAHSTAEAIARYILSDDA